MFDFFDLFSFGRKINIDGKEWVVLKSLAGNLALAVDGSQTTPCQVYLIELPVQANEKAPCES